MLETDITDTTAMKRARKKKKNCEKRKQNCRLGTASKVYKNSYQAHIDMSPYILFVVKGNGLLGHSGFNWWFSFAPVFQWYCFIPCGFPGVTIRFCLVLISDS